MKSITQNKHPLVILAIISTITILHYLTPSSLPFLHDLYRRLYYLPIIYATLTLGLRWGLVTTAIVSTIFLPHIFYRWGQISSQTYDAFFEIILYFAIANITGTLVEMEKRRRRELASVREEMATLISKSLRPVKPAKAAKRQINLKYHFGTMIGESAAIHSVYDIIKKTSSTKTTILVLGETGTGKELVAQAIHQHSPRKDNPFVAINCSAIPETLLESELFGYKKGAFTGADRDKPGKFEMADGGTLFLDEIGSMSPDLQVKLLRVIQDKEVQPVGGTESIKTNVRLISATNDDLEEKIRHNQFRADLYYRLHVVNIDLPPLRQRMEDIPLLAEYFLRKYGSSNLSLSTETMKVLQNYNWPGNIRELENVIHRAVTLNQGSLVMPQDLPHKIHRGKATVKNVPLEIPEEGLNIEEVEKTLLQAALTKTGGNQSQAAKLLGLSRPAFIYRIQKFQLR